MKVLKDNIAMILAAHVAVLAEPAIVHAEGNYHPINFTQPLQTERGELGPIGQNAYYLNNKERCDLAKKEWGWSDCSGMDQLVFDMGEDISTMLLSDPVSEGFVKLDDFFQSGARDEIDSMTASYKEQLADQSKRTGTKIEFAGWRLYPTADKSHNVIYYALDSRWDGAPTTNIKIMILDRYGYFTMGVVPQRDDLGADEIKSVVDQAIAAYKPKPTAAYENFQSGDKVAVYGGLGVLATVLGVKYGKAATVGLLAGLALVLKKAAFLIIVPLVALGGFIKRLFRGKPSTTA
jgi:uncharacterized membrane-anchored protein